MRKIDMWVGGIGVIGTIIFMLKNNYEDRKEIKRLEKESRSWYEKVCALEGERADIQYILRKMEEELNKAMVKSGITHSQAETLDDYIWGD